MTAKKNKTIELPEVNFSEDGESRYLHLGTPWIQGAMKIKEPFELELEYIQRMMVGLLFLKSASVAGRHAMQLGLGAASLTKFCYKKLRWTCTAIELNPGVLHAGLTALLAGIVLVGLHDSVKPDETLNHTKVGIKLLVLIVILALGYKNLKKPELSKNVWLTMIGLTVFNIVIASAR